MIALRQSTASQEVTFGYFVDSTDGDTEETGLTIANTDIKIWKSGTTTLTSKNSGGATHISNGIYYATLDATDTDTVGPMIIYIHVSGALTVRLECHVFEEAIFDAFWGASAGGYATAAALATAQTDLDTLTGSDGVTLATSQPNYAPNTVVPDAAGTAPTAVEIRQEMDSNSTQLASILTDTGTTIPGLIGTPVADLATDIATVDGNVDSILTDTGTTLPATLSTINTNVSSILTDTGTTLPTLIGTPADTDIATDIANAQTILNSFTFTVAGQVDANIQYVNDTAVTGDGGSGTEWGP